MCVVASLGWIPRGELRGQVVALLAYLPDCFPVLRLWCFHQLAECPVSPGPCQHHWLSLRITALLVCGGSLPPFALGFLSSSGSVIFG